MVGGLMNHSWCHPNPVWADGDEHLLKRKILKLDVGIVAVEQVQFVLDTTQAVATAHVVGESGAIVVYTQVQVVVFFVNPDVDPP